MEWRAYSQCLLSVVLLCMPLHFACAAPQPDSGTPAPGGKETNSTFMQRLMRPDPPKNDALQDDKIRAYRLPQPDPMTGDKSAWETTWTYFPDGDELSDVDWSPTGRHLALVQQVHWPDGGAAHNYPRWQLTMLRRRAQIDPRFADPRIILLKPGTDEVTEIDYGWNPKFSPDGRRLAYTRQARPITGKRRMVAATGAGNEIVVMDLSTRKKVVWARPEPDHQYLNPIWLDADTMVVSDCSATNGALLGCTHRVRVTKGQVVGKLSERRPGRASTTTGRYLWDESDDGLELLHVNASGRTKVSSLRSLSDDLVLLNGLADSPLQARNRRALLSQSGRWHSIDLRTGKLRKRGPSPFSVDPVSPNVFASRNGRWFLYSTAQGFLADGIYLARAFKPKGTRIWAGPGVLMDAQWSSKDRQVALILSRRGAGDPDTRIAGDELVLLKVPTAPAKRNVRPYSWQSNWVPATP